MWTRLHRLTDGASTAGLRAHGLQLVAGEHWFASGSTRAASVADDGRHAQAAHLVAEELLRRIRALVDGPVVVIKGIEVACHYGFVGGRPYGDLDILVPDAQAVMGALVADGWVQSRGQYDDHHHLAAVRAPSLPMPIEVHHSLGWEGWSRPPSSAEVIAAAVPSSTGIEGVLAPDPVTHTLFLANHSWRNRPFSQLRDLLDLAVVSARTEPGAIEEQAAEWKLGRLWALMGATMRAVLLDDGPVPAAAKVMGKHLLAIEPADAESGTMSSIAGMALVADPAGAARHTAADIRRIRKQGRSLRAALRGEKR